MIVISHVSIPHHLSLRISPVFPASPQITLVEVTRRSGWIRGQGPEAILASHSLKDDEVGILADSADYRQWWDDLGDDDD